MPPMAVRQPRAARAPARWSASDRKRLEIARAFCEQPAYKATSWQPAVPHIGCLPCAKVAEGVEPQPPAKTSGVPFPDLARLDLARRLTN